MIARLMGLKTITPDAVQGLLRDRNAVVIDVNSAASFTEAHVPGATRLDHDTYSDVQLPPDKDTSIVFYCSGNLCRKAPHAARRASSMGYRDVRVMSAGINGWVARGLPTHRTTA